MNELRDAPSGAAPRKGGSLLLAGLAGEQLGAQIPVVPDLALGLLGGVAAGAQLQETLVLGDVLLVLPKEIRVVHPGGEGGGGGVDGTADVGVDRHVKLHSENGGFISFLTNIFMPPNTLIFRIYP